MIRTFTNRLGISLLLAAGMSVAAPSGVVLAQQHSAVDIAQARELFKQGLNLREKGDNDGALGKFRAAYALAGTPITGLELGRTYMAIGKLVEARESFLPVDRSPQQPEETARSSAACAESAQLAEQVRSRIPSLTVKVTGVAAASVAVTIDGALVPAEALATPRLLDPGNHSVFARSTRGTAETKVDLKEGEARDVELKIVFAGEVPPAATAPPASSPSNLPAPLEAAPTHPGRTQRVIGLAVGGAGLIGLGVGGVLGLVAKAQDNTAAGEQWPANHDDSLSASHMADAATVVFIVGAAAAATGAILWFAAPNAHASLGTNGSELFVNWRF